MFGEVNNEVESEVRFEDVQLRKRISNVGLMMSGAEAWDRTKSGKDVNQNHACRALMTPLNNNHDYHLVSVVL
jgi:hypothetical protein